MRSQSKHPERLLALLVLVPALCAGQTGDDPACDPGTTVNRVLDGSADWSHLDGWIQEPSDHLQRNLDGTKISLIGESKTDVVVLDAASESRAINDCEWDYSVEIELRSARDRYRGRATHESGKVSRDDDARGTFRYPAVHVAGLSLATAYKWATREKVVAYTAFIKNGKLYCVDPETRRSRWSYHHPASLFSFRTPPPTTPVIEFPAFVKIEAGTLVSGGEDDLVSDDDVFLQLTSLADKPHRFEWHAGFVGMPKEPRNLRFTFTGRASTECVQALEIFDFRRSLWVELDSRTVGTDEVRIDQVGPALPGYRFVDNSGESRVRFQATCADAADSYNDLLRMDFGVVPSPWNEMDLALDREVEELEAKITEGEDSEP